MKAVLRIRKEPGYRRLAFEQGLKRVGFTLTESAVPDGPESWLCLWNRQGANEVEADQWESRGGTVVIAENGYLAKVDKTFYAIAVHGHAGSGWAPVGDEDRFTSLGFPLKPLDPNRTGYILIAAQRGVGSREMRSPPQWGENIAKKLKQQGIVHKLRIHPGNRPPVVPLVNDLAQARECWVWSSAAGVRALVEGVSVKHHAPHWICAGEREAALHRMSHSQWHHEEIATGEPFARVIAHRKEAVW